MLWSMVSNAADRSKRFSKLTLPESQSVSMSFMTLTDKGRYRLPSPFMGNGGSARCRLLISD